MQKFLSFILSFSIFLMAVSPAPPILKAEANNLSVEEARQLLVRTDNKYEPPQYEALMLMRNHRPDRERQENKLRLLRKNDKMLVIFLEPPSQRGQVFIRDGDDMWMYLPRSNKVMRIGAKDALMGGEASNADLMRTAMAEDYNPVYLGEEVIDGITCYKLELTAKRRTVAYDKVIYWIGKEKDNPVRRDYYALSGKKLRTMYFSDLRLLGGFERPTRIKIENAEQKEYWTEMILEEVNLNVKWEDYIFTPAYVRQGIFH
ncbi:MAG: outer membrane lipoprotein-sorting protein [Firmicutes bacterium]|nr:outer membrane lipoprotein-sorting protein [Bacillota bacterium]